MLRNPAAEYHQIYASFAPVFFFDGGRFVKTGSLILRFQKYSSAFVKGLKLENFFFQLNYCLFALSFNYLVSFIYFVYSELSFH